MAYSGGPTAYLPGTKGKLGQYWSHTGASISNKGTRSHAAAVVAAAKKTGAALACSSAHEPGP